jgi:uncharacterized iron-regulated membrane protein
MMLLAGVVFPLTGITMVIALICEWIVGRRRAGALG